MNLKRRGRGMKEEEEEERKRRICFYNRLSIIRCCKVRTARHDAAPAERDPAAR
jgi:hypothetical protein